MELKTGERKETFFFLRGKSASSEDDEVARILFLLMVFSGGGGGLGARLSIVFLARFLGFMTDLDEVGDAKMEVVEICSDVPTAEAR